MAAVAAVEEDPYRFEGLAGVRDGGHRVAICALAFSFIVRPKKPRASFPWVAGSGLLVISHGFSLVDR